MEVASTCTSINKNIKADVILLDLAVDGAPQLLFEHCKKNNIKVDYLINNGIHFSSCLITFFSYLVKQENMQKIDFDLFFL
jgi:short-subunit dehydrogenase